MNASSSLICVENVQNYQDTRMSKKIEFNLTKQRHLPMNLSLAHQLPVQKTPTAKPIDLPRTSSPKVKKTLCDIEQSTIKNDFMKKLSDSQRKN